MPQYRDLHLKAAGVSFKNPDGSSRRKILARVYDDWFIEGLERRVRLVLRPDDENEHDENAVKVLVDIGKGLEQVGYVPATWAIRIRKLLRARRIAGVSIKNMAAGNKGAVSLELSVRVRVGK